MGGIVVLHPQDVLGDGYYYNRMPLSSPSPSTNHALKTDSHRRKRSPQKLTNDFTKLEPKRSNFDHTPHNKINYLSKSPANSSNIIGPQKKTSDLCRRPPHKVSNFDPKVNYSINSINDLCKSPPKRSDFGNSFNEKTSDLSRFPPKSSNFDKKGKRVSQLARFPPKGSTNLTSGVISSGNMLVMEKVKILKRGEALTNYGDTKKKTVFSNEENMMVNLENCEVSDTEKKMVLFDKETKYGKVVNLENSLVPNTKKKVVSFGKGIKYEKLLNLENSVVPNTKKKVVSFGKGIKYEKLVNLENSVVPNTKKKVVSFDKDIKYEKLVNSENNEVPNTKKKMVLFDKENKNKKVFLEKNEDLRPNIDLDSVELVMRLGPESGMLPKHIELGNLYAGSPFVASPDPSSLPFPPFLKKGTSEIELTQKIDGSNEDDNGSSHLRRLLKLAF